MILIRHISHEHFAEMDLIHMTYILHKYSQTFLAELTLNNYNTNKDFRIGKIQECNISGGDFLNMCYTIDSLVAGKSLQDAIYAINQFKKNNKL